MMLAECDDYPTEQDLERIEQWPVRSMQDGKALLEFARTLWKWSSGFAVNEITTQAKFSAYNYYLSTSSWSGNEDIIKALRANRRFWWLCWQAHRRGGHYEFAIELPRRSLADYCVEANSQSFNENNVNLNGGRIRTNTHCAF